MLQSSDPFKDALRDCKIAPSFSFCTRSSEFREIKPYSVIFQIIMCGSNLETFHEDKIPKNLLPTEYLPDDYTGPNNGSIKDLISE